MPILNNLRVQSKSMDFLQQLGIRPDNKGTSTGIEWLDDSSASISSFSPVDGKQIALVSATGKAAYDQVVSKAREAFHLWRAWPAPKRGEIVRQIGEALREKKPALGRLVSYEMGKSLQEGLGEVQEMIDICDFAVGLSRQLYGLTMNSKRPMNRMYEQWHPFGVVGIISAFNFPVAVWSWNAALAWVCGDVCIWKPSSKTPLCAIACQNLIAEVFRNVILWKAALSWITVRVFRPPEIMTSPVLGRGDQISRTSSDLTVRSRPNIYFRKMKF